MYLTGKLSAQRQCNWIKALNSQLMQQRQCLTGNPIETFEIMRREFQNIREDSMSNQTKLFARACIKDAITR